MWRLVRPPTGMPTIEGGPVPVTSDEPLKRELEDFVDAIRHRRAPHVTGEDGRRALALAHEITQQMLLTTDAAVGPHFSAATDRRD